MIPYIIIILYLAYNAYRFDYRGMEFGKVWQENIAICILIVFAGVRFHIGIDSMSYESEFDSTIPTLNNLFGSYYFENSTQKMWVLLSSTIKTVFHSFVAFQFIHAALFNGLLLRFLRKTTTRIFTVLLIFFLVQWYYYNFEILRESLCVVLFLNAVLELNERKYVNYIVIALVSLTLHYFAFVMYGLAPFIFLVPPKWTYSILAMLSAFVVFYVDSSFLNMAVYSFAENLDDNTSTRMLAYTSDYAKEGFHTMNFFGVLEIAVMGVLFPFLCMRLLPEGKYSKLFKQLLILYILFSILRTTITIAYRFNNYITIIFIVCLVECLFIRDYSKNVRYYLLLGLVCLFTYRSVVTFYQPHPVLETRSHITYDVRYIPYSTVFQDPLPERESFQRY